jgi:S-adenosylmethionine-diacylgycerolhomoserine-N-methlytransferase
VFLSDREEILNDLRLRPGETVVEVGCGAGQNLDGILYRIRSSGRVLAIDNSAPMVERCERRVRDRGWKNVEIVDTEYGNTPLTDGKADVVLMSYSLSMIPAWQQVLECATAELKPGGRIGVVDFCLETRNIVTLGFARWMERNHVTLDSPYRETLVSSFQTTRYITRQALGGLWAFYRFVGQRR